MKYTKSSIRSNPSQSSFIDKLMVDRRASEFGEPGSICRWLLSQGAKPPSLPSGIVPPPLPSGIIRRQTPPVTPALRHAPDPAFTPSPQLASGPAPPDTTPLWKERVDAANQEAAEAARNWEDHVSWEWPSDLSKDHPPGFEYGPKHKRLSA